MSLENHVATIRPVLKSARLTKLNVNSWQWAAGSVTNAINGIIQRYIVNINGQIAPIVHRIDPTSIGLNGQPTTIEISPGKSVTLPGATLGPAAVLIDKDGLHLLAQLDVVREILMSMDASISYSDYEQEFWQRAADVRAGSNRTQAGLFLSTTFVTNMLEPVFTPLVLEDLQQIALQNTLEATKVNGIVAAGVSIKGSVLQENLTTSLADVLQDTETIQYGDPEASLSEQTIVVKLPVEGLFEAAHIRFKGEITAAGIIANNAGQLYYRFVLVSLHLNEAEHMGGAIGLAPFVGSVNDLLMQLIPYINGAMDDEPIDIPLPKIKPIPVVQPDVTIKPSELTFIDPGAIVLIPRLTISGLSTLVVVAPEVDKETKSAHDFDLLRAQQVAFQNRPGTESALAVGQQTVTPEEVNQSFSARWNSSLPSHSGTYENNLTAALSLPWTISYVNQTLAENRIEISAPINSEKTEFDSGHLRVADWLQPNCTVGLTCNRNQCDRARCTRPHGRCGWSCLVCVNLVFKKVCTDDPVCLSTRAACNLKEEANVAACNAAEESKLAACNIAEEAKLAACNAERELQIFGCNIVNETIRAIRELDSIGRFNGDVQATGVAKVSNPEIRYDAQASKLELSVDANVRLHMDGKLGFTPADIGHLLVCPFQGSVNFSADGSLLRGRTKLSARLNPGSNNPDGSLPLEMRFDPVTLSGQLSPAPVDALLNQNPHLFILCSPVVSVAGSIGNIGKISAYTPLDIFKAIERGILGDQENAYRALIAFSTGRINETLSVPPMKLEIQKLEIKISDQSIGLVPEWKDGNLVYVQH